MPSPGRAKAGATPVADAVGSQRAEGRASEPVRVGNRWSSRITQLRGGDDFRDVDWNLYGTAGGCF